MTHCEMQTKTVKERLIKHNIKCLVVQKKKIGQRSILKASTEQSSIHAMQREEAMMKQMKRRCKRPPKLRTKGISQKVQGQKCAQTELCVCCAII